MIDFTIQTHIAKPPGEVFAYVADPSKLHTWQTNTVSTMVVGGGPVGLGSRIVEVHRVWHLLRIIGEFSRITADCHPAD